MHTIALDQSALLELLDVLKAADAGDVVRNAVEAVFQALIDAEAATVIGAGPHERTPARVTQRNGHRDRLLTTAAGDLELRIPKLRSDSPREPCASTCRTSTPGCTCPAARPPSPARS